MSFFKCNGGTATAEPTRLTLVPCYRVRETEDAFVVTAHVPGVAKPGVETTVDEDKLIIVARRADSAPGDWVAVHRESSDADYRLVLELDHRVNRDAVKAELSQGVLTLTVPKAEAVKPRRIEIG
jgi:HSP20 family molecular chaperone IbpA